MNTFSDVVDAADSLTIDEQESLLEILRQRIAQRNRERLLEDVRAVRAEFASGQGRFASPKEIMDEVRGES